ncbi:hypothetical protein ACFY1S_00160 [Micromonospora sp. NPDC000663]|uniref:hypothetical protein n=1 Tax=Micromonospora sp. NPDC000663 TaxID=3364218 RepID=UPI0036C0F9C9
MSEYTQRYEGRSHQELYDAVMAGDPEQIEGVAAQWASLKSILDGLGRELSGDLEKLGNTWTGAAGQEFQRRVGLVTVHSDALGEGMAGVTQALTMMAGQLRTAHKQAESPEETDDNDQLVNGALRGSAFGLPGAVIGGMLGHQQDKQEQEKAHQRMVTVVAELAAGYDISVYDRVVEPEPPPPGTPKTADDGRTTPRSGPHTAPATVAPTISGHTARTGDATIATPGRADPPGIVGGGTPPVEGGTGDTPGVVTVADDTAGGGTVLAGADPLVGGALLAGGAAGLAGLSGPAAVPAATTGAGLLFGSQGGAPAGGVLRTSALASSGGTPTPSARPASTPAPTDNRAASGIGRSIDGRRADGTGRTAGGANRPGLLGGRGRPGEDESDERLTWLTEDEMVWREGGAAAPPVLGTND